MSVQKFNPTVRGESIPFVQVNRKVVQNIYDPEALAVWVYLLSLPEDWEVIKIHVQNHFRISEKKLKRIFALLRKLCLIDYEQGRDERGRRTKTSIIVLNGSRFRDLSTETVTASPITAPPVDGTCRQEGLHIKQIHKETVNKKSSYASLPKKPEAEKPESPTEEPRKATREYWRTQNVKKQEWAERSLSTKETRGVSDTMSQEYRDSLSRPVASEQTRLEGYARLPLHFVPKNLRETVKRIKDEQLMACNESPSKIYDRTGQIGITT